VGGAASAALSAAGEAHAQSDAQTAAMASFDRSPPLGYERQGMRLGSTSVFPELRIGAIADSNVFATSSNEDEDVIGLIEPSIAFANRSAKLDFGANAYGGFRRYFENENENVETFGANAKIRYQASNVHSGSLAAGYDRGFQRRYDPERNANFTIPPTLIDNLWGEAGYLYRPGRLGLGATAGVFKSNYKDPIDDERDLTSYRASARALIGASSRVDFFVEGYGVWRDFRLPVDLSGVNRDGETYGANAGVAFEVTDKLTGDFGVGYFTANFDDPSLREFSGLGFSGSVNWRPQARTAIVVDAFRGDVATNRTGASGRIDTRGSIRLYQEIRHNLRGRLEIGYRHGEFRRSGLTQDDLTAGAAVEFLFNRHLAAELGYNFRDRDATVALDEFTTHQATLSLIVRY
jgi:hypothetical protein